MKNNSVIKKVGFGFTAAGIIFSYTSACAACLGLNIQYALISAVICSLLSIPLKNNILAPDGFLLVPAVYILSVSGQGGLSLSLIIGSVLYILMKSLKKDFSLPDCIIVGGALGLAFSVTALFTTLYFGIGATGSTTWEMLKNYRYLGFHPNWRGVFYGTITLFSMITYPFKFKKLSKYLPKEVFSVGIPFLLNLWLNPVGETTPILEVGSLSDLKNGFTLNSMFPVKEFFADFSFGNLLLVLGTAICFAVILYSFDNKNYSPCGVSNLLCGAEGGFPCRPYEILHYSPVSAVISVITIILIVLFAPSLLARVPLHSLAVVFIVSAWQNVPYKKVAETFKQNGIIEILSVFAIFFSFFFLQPFFAVCVCVLLTILIKGVRK